MSFVLLTFTSRHFGCGLALLDWLLVLFLVIWLGFLCLAVGINWVSCQILASRPDEKLVSVNSPDRWIALCWPGNNSTARTFINVEVLKSDNAFVTESRTTDAGKKKVQQQWTNKSCQHGEPCTMFHMLLWEHCAVFFQRGWNSTCKEAFIDSRPSSQIHTPCLDSSACTFQDMWGCGNTCSHK